MAGRPLSEWRQVVDRCGLTATGDVLDVGCGGGAWLPILAETNRRVVGVDVDLDAIEMARQRSRQTDKVEIRPIPAERPTRLPGAVAPPDPRWVRAYVTRSGCSVTQVGPASEVVHSSWPQRRLGRPLFLLLCATKAEWL